MTSAGTAGGPGGSSRHRDGALVQGGRRPGPDPLGLRPRPGGHAPRRVLLHHRPGLDPARDRHPLRRPLEHRIHLPGVPRPTSDRRRRGAGAADTVLRAAPCLFGLYSVVALLYHALPEAKRSGGVRWPGKAGVTFSDALASVRLWVWSEGVFPQAGEAVRARETPRSLARSPAVSPRTGGIAAEDRHQSS